MSNFVESPERALFLIRNYGVRFLWRYSSRALHRNITIDADVRQIVSLFTPGQAPGHCVGLAIAVEGMARLNGLSEDHKEALKMVGLWPTVEAKQLEGI